jgi:hypothetical protein
MALFGRTSPEKNLTTAIQKQRTLRDDLAKRLEIARTTVADSNAAAKDMARTGGDDAALSAADAVTISAERLVVLLTAALVEADQSLANLERQRAELEDQKTRRDTCDEIQRICDELHAAGAAFDAAASRLTAAAKRAGLVLIDGKGLELFAGQLRDAVAPAIDLILSAMRSHSAAVMSGHAPAVIGKPEAPSAPVVKLEPKTRVFSMTPVKWRERGEEQRSATHQQVDLPTAIAARSLKTGHVIEMTNPRSKTLYVGFVAAPHSAACVDLDDVNLKPLRAVFGQDILKRDAGFHVTRGGSESWISAERG